MRLKLDTIQSEAILNSISPYLSPEMSILISGIGFSSIPFPWMFFDNFTGCFHEFIDGYLYKYYTNNKLNIHTTIKPYKFKHSKKAYDLSVFGLTDHNFLSDLSNQKTNLKEGGYLLYILGKESKLNRELFLSEDFELIEESKLGDLSYFLVKKGWDNIDDLDQHPYNPNLFFLLPVRSYIKS